MVRAVARRRGDREREDQDARKQPADAVTEPTGLPRLPPGRHGLPRDFVVQNQRDRIAAGMISTVAERGYHETTISQIAAAAGVSRRTFYGYYSSKEECFFATYDMVADHLRAAVRGAASEGLGWPEAVRARLAAALEFFAANPNLVRFTLVAPPRAGSEIAARYQLGVERSVAELFAPMPPAPEGKVVSDAVQQSLIGGMSMLVVRKVEAGEGEQLIGLLPDVVELALTPFVGRDEAVRVARGRA